jgi:hypothetical protein
MSDAREQIAQHLRSEIKSLPVQTPARFADWKSNASLILRLREDHCTPRAGSKRHWRYDGGIGGKLFPKYCIFRTLPTFLMQR